MNAVGSPFLVTLSGMLDRCQVPERAMRSVGIVVHPPGLDLGACILHRHELHDVQTSVTPSAVSPHAVAQPFRAYAPSDRAPGAGARGTQRGPGVLHRGTLSFRRAESRSGRHRYVHGSARSHELSLETLAFKRRLSGPNTVEQPAFVRGRLRSGFAAVVSSRLAHSADRRSADFHRVRNWICDIHTQRPWWRVAVRWGDTNGR
jgi:hypothetical protein